MPMLVRDVVVLISQLGYDGRVWSASSVRTAGGRNVAALCGVHPAGLFSGKVGPDG